MTAYYNGKEVNDMYYNGHRVLKAYYNGEEVYNGGIVLYDGDWYVTDGNANLNFDTTMPYGCKVKITPAIDNMYSKVYYGSPDFRSVAGSVTEFIAEIPFTGLWCGVIDQGYSPTVTLHVKITMEA